MTPVQIKTTQHGRQLDLLHTPVGLRDCVGAEMAQKQTILGRIGDKMRLYGYEQLETPTIEFFDVFSNEVGTTPSRELYKFFDKEGNTLVLRPDFTPSVARVASRYFRGETAPLRFCYRGSAFYNHASDLQGKLRETTQIGAELMNEPSVHADAEMIALLIESLLSTGLQEFRISIGNAEYFRGLCREADLSAEDEAELRDAISRRNYFAAEDLLKSRGYDRSVRDKFLSFADFLENGQELGRLLESAGSERTREALERLISLDGVLREYGVADHVNYDLSLLSKYNYYTGVIFKAYTYGTGEPVAAGGRYDRLLSFFGMNAPAVGAMIAVDPLMEALRRQKIEVSVPEEAQTVSYQAGDDASFRTSLRQAASLRAQGKAAVLIPDAQSEQQEGTACRE